MTSQLQRQSLGCGYEPSTDRVRLAIWEPPRGAKAYHGPVPTICPGYTTALPEVLETFGVRLHWEKGAVQYACGGEPTEEMLTSIVIMDTAYKSVERWALTPASEGGGGK